jgi:hypothetical protein
LKEREREKGGGVKVRKKEGKKEDEIVSLILREVITYLFSS